MSTARVPLGGGRFLAAPAVLGQLLTQMMPERGQRALVVGAGTGYSAAVLAAMGLRGRRDRKRSPSLPPKRARASASTSSRDRSRPAHAQGRALRSDPDRWRGRVIPDAIVAQLADGGRLGTALSTAASRAYRRPQGGRRVRLSLHRRCGGSGAARLHPPESIHLLRGSECFESFISASLVAALMAGTASADTLREALVSAYQTNPTLTAQRETLRATDANVAIARAAGRPQVSATVGLNRDLTRSGILDHRRQRAATCPVGADLSCPLFNGGAVKNSVRAAEDARRGRPRNTARRRRRRLHPGRRGLHGRDPRPRDRRAQRRTM